MHIIFHLSNRQQNAIWRDGKTLELALPILDHLPVPVDPWQFAHDTLPKKFHRFIRDAEEMEIPAVVADRDNVGLNGVLGRIPKPNNMAASILIPVVRVVLLDDDVRRGTIQMQWPKSMVIEGHEIPSRKASKPDGRE